MIKKAEYWHTWRSNNKKQLIAAKGGKCELCGYHKCDAALEFHHKDPKEKDILHLANWSLSKSLKEIEDCLLICSNCHRELHILIRMDKY